MPSHHHPSQHPSAYPSPYPPGQSVHPSYHHSSRHVSNGPPPPPGVAGGHPGPMGGPPEHPMPGPPPMGNGQGHAHHPPPPPPQNGPLVSAAARAGKEKQDGVLAQLASANENTWMLIGAVAEQMQDQDRANAAFENALRHNPNSILGLNAVASIARSRDDFDKAIEYFQRILNIKQDNGEVWGSMGHCLLMKDDLPKAYTAYQQALYHLANPKEPKLWYGIGILYDRYGSFEHAEEAFSSVLRMDPNFEKANEIYFRLGIIYKHQRKYDASLQCFKYILQDPPRPLTSWDIWFQLGHVYEQDRDYENARDAYMRVLTHQPDHAKVLQQLGWLHHQPGAPFADQDKAVSYLTKSLETDGSDAQSWYLLGRAFMAGGERYNKAYEAYQQAVYRDGRNPTFWCSIGVLYYQINQYRDALDAYSRAIRLNPFISEVWYNLGSLYESCNNQITDAIDAYTRAADLDPTNASIKRRLNLLQNASSSNGPLPPAPGPVDVHPSQYTAQPQGPYPPGGSPGNSPRGVQMAPPGSEPQDGPNGRALPPPPPVGELGRGSSPGPFRGGNAAPPPLQHVDESRGNMSRHAPLAPMETDPRDGRDPRDMRDGRDHRDHREHRDPRDHRHDGPPGPRYDPAADAARRPPSPGSPGRRGAYPYPPYYGGRDREREEWERRNSRGGPLPGPSPRMHDRPIMPPGRQPSPRHPDYAYGFPHDGRPPYPYDRREPTPGTNGGMGQPRMPSGPYSEDPRAPSPAPSSVVSVGGRRKRDEEPKSAKKERAVSKRASGDKKTGLKVTLRAGGGESSSRSPKVDEVSPTSSRMPIDPPTTAMPSRAVDEDYDEGALDALMTLHGDRPPSDPSSPNAPVVGNKRAASPNSPPNSKKARPEGVNRLSSAAASGSGRGGSSSPATRQVIEVLNTPSIGTPLSRPEGPSPDAIKKDREAEQVSSDEAKSAEASESAEKNKTEEDVEMKEDKAEEKTNGHDEQTSNSGENVEAPGTVEPAAEATEAISAEKPTEAEPAQPSEAEAEANAPAAETAVEGKTVNPTGDAQETAPTATAAVDETSKENKADEGVKPVDGDVDMEGEVAAAPVEASTEGKTDKASEDTSVAEGIKVNGDEGASEVENKEKTDSEPAVATA